MISPYLSDLGIKEESLPWNFRVSKSKKKAFKKQREEHGFDARDTWDLDSTLAYLIYPRLKMYAEESQAVGDEGVYEFENVKYSLDELINMCLKEFESYFTEQNSDQPHLKRAFEILAATVHSLWW